MARPLTALGGDIFAGLFTVGVTRAGFQVLGHLEHGAYGVATARKNFPDLDIRIGPHAWEPERFKGKVDFMYTNPPCAAWSTMRTDHHKPWQEHKERLSCVTDLVHAGTIIRPKAWCWESVTGAWARGKEFVLEQARVWNQHGYHVTVLLQNNMYIGSTQQRERMFLIAHLHPLVWPPFTEPRTTDQILKSVPKRGLPKPPYTPKALPPLLEELWRRSEGHGYLRHVYERMSDKERAKFPGPIPMAVHRRLHGDRPPPVMMEDLKRLHPREPRALTYHEWLAVTGLPWDWQTGATSFTSFTLELSRAVMPGVGEWLATAVKAGLALKPLRKKDGLVTTRLLDLRQGPKKEPIEELLLEHRVEGPLQPLAWAPEVPQKPITEPRARSTQPRDPNAPVVPRGLGIGRRIRELLTQGLGTQEILTLIHQEFPTSKATASDIGWNRAKLRKEQQHAA